MKESARARIAYRGGRQDGIRYAAKLAGSLAAAWRRMGDDEAADAAEALAVHLAWASNDKVAVNFEVE